MKSGSCQKCHIYDGIIFKMRIIFRIPCKNTMARAYSHHWTIATRISHIPIQSDSPISYSIPLAHVFVFSCSLSARRKDCSSKHLFKESKIKAKRAINQFTNQCLKKPARINHQNERKIIKD